MAAPKEDITAPGGLAAEKRVQESVLEMPMSVKHGRCLDLWIFRVRVFSTAPSIHNCMFFDVETLVEPECLNSRLCIYGFIHSLLYFGEQGTVDNANVPAVHVLDRKSVV